MICSMSRPGNVWNDAAMESFFSSLKTERTARKTCCSPSFTTVVNRGTEIYPAVHIAEKPWPGEPDRTVNSESKAPALRFWTGAPGLVAEWRRLFSSPATNITDSAFG